MASQPHRAESETERSNMATVVVIFVAIPVIAMAVIGWLAFRVTPLGEARICERFITDEQGLRLTAQPVEIGGREAQQQRFEYSTDGGMTWKTLIDVTIRNPEVEIDCDRSIGVLAGQALRWVWNDRRVALSRDGQNWEIWEVCDEPRPDFGCVEREHIQAVAGDTDMRVQVDVFAPEGPYTVTTQDGGQTWQLAE